MTRPAPLCSAAVTAAAAACVLLVSLVVTEAATCPPVTLKVQEDVTIFESGAGGAGLADKLYAGRHGSSQRGNRFRMLFKFDLEAVKETCPGAKVASATVSLDSPRRKSSSSAGLSLHAVSKPWTEGGGTNADPVGGTLQRGQPSWTARAHQIDDWGTPGGDFRATASADGPTPCSTRSTCLRTLSSAGLVRDVQAWLDGQEANNGWIAIGEEAIMRTAQHFSSAGTSLTVTFEEPPTDKTTTTAAPTTTTPATTKAPVRCTNNLYLLDGSGCVETCPDDLVPWGQKPNGRVCRAPFTCRLTEGCECEAPGGCAECQVTPSGSVCLTCKDSRFPVEGKCLKEAICKGGKLVGNPDKLKCTCNTEQYKNPKCNQCKLTGGTAAPVATCQKCKDSLYLHSGLDGFCGEASGCRLPAVPTGVNLIGRICTAPFTCRKGRATDGDRPGSKCSCSDKRNCHTCSWTESGDACTRCMNKFYNAPDGTCLEDCVGVEGFPETLTHGGATGSGRACERPFTCANNVHSLTQGKCRCSDKKNCKSCEYRAGNGKLESFCTDCKGKFVANSEGLCVKP